HSGRSGVPARDGSGLRQAHAARRGRSRRSSADVKRHTLAAILLTACGARTALLTTDFDASIDDAGKPDVRDGSRDSPMDDPADNPIPDDVPITPQCPDGGPTYVYVITQQNELYSFLPSNLTFKKIGDIQCPG